MEKLPHLDEDTRFFFRIAAFAAGISMLLYSCMPEDRTLTDEQRRDPDFIECVEYRLTHDKFDRASGPQGMTVGPTDQEVAEDRCLDDLFPVN